MTATATATSVVGYITNSRGRANEGKAGGYTCIGVGLGLGWAWRFINEKESGEEVGGWVAQV